MISLHLLNLSAQKCAITRDHNWFKINSYSSKNKQKSNHAAHCRKTSSKIAYRMKNLTILESSSPRSAQIIKKKTPHIILKISFHPRLYKIYISSKSVFTIKVYIKYIFSIKIYLLYVCTRSTKKHKKSKYLKTKI